MEILSIEVTRPQAGGVILRFQPKPNGDIDVVESFSADDNFIRTTIPKQNLREVADFLKAASED